MWYPNFRNVQFGTQFCKEVCRNRNRDGTTNQKKKTGFKKRDLGVATIVIPENYGKP